MSLAAALTLAGLCTTAAQAAGPIHDITKLWSFQHAAVGVADARSSEIAQWDATTQSLFVVGGNGIDVLGLNGTLRASLTTTGFGAVNSIAIFGGVAAVAFANSVVQDPGSVRFYDTASFIASNGAAGLLGGVTVGAVPDNISWTPDGTRLLVANEGERQSDAVNPEGSISLISFNAANPSASAVSKLGFNAWDGREAALRSAGVRIQSGVAASIALEPEYVAVSPDGRFAHVTLQENNALAIIDLAAATPSVTRIVTLGLKDFSLPGNHIDPSDRDAKLELRSAPVKGLYMPDGIAAFAAGGRTFFALANEGDAFGDDSDVLRLGNAAVTLDPVVFPDAATLKLNANLGRLNIVRHGATGDGGSTNLSEIVAIGGRSFSVRDEDGNLVYDSGNLLEAEAIRLGLYDDGRSDDRGVEPEGVAVFTVAGRTVAVVGLERTTRGAAALFDVTDPANVSFLQIVDSGSAGEIRIEGVQGFVAADGQLYMSFSSEVPSNVTALYRITPVPEPTTWALALGGLAMLGARLRRQNRGGNTAQTQRPTRLNLSVDAG